MLEANQFALAHASFLIATHFAIRHQKKHTQVPFQIELIQFISADLFGLFPFTRHYLIY
jgi:hypothetical protein